MRTISFLSPRNHLSDRYQHILKATIQHYIATAEPVGSKTLIEEYKFTVSSATIRNALGKLEKEGLLYQPHTSSGRIPSDWGYRLYVDELMTPDDRIGEKIGYYLHKNAKSPAWSLESLKETLVVQELAKVAGIEVSAEAVTEKIAKIMVQLSDRDIDRQRLEQVITEEMLAENTLEWLKEKATITLVPKGSLEEETREDEETEETFAFTEVEVLAAEAEEE